MLLIRVLASDKAVGKGDLGIFDALMLGAIIAT